MTIQELLIDRYAPLHNLAPRSVILFTSSVDRLRDFLGREPLLTDFTDLTMAKFLRWRAEHPVNRKTLSPASVAKDKAHLSALANHAFKKRLIEECVEWPRLRVPTRVPQAYTYTDIEKMIAAAKNCRGVIDGVPADWFFASMIWTAFVTGERIGALLALKWQEVHLDERLITFLGETRKDRCTTIQREITPELAEFLGSRARRPSQLVWPWKEHRNMVTIYHRLRAICKWAGVTYRGFHALRKSSCSYVKAAGGDPTEHAGHANPRTTMAYLAPAITGRKSGLEFLPSLNVAWVPEEAADPAAEAQDEAMRAGFQAGKRIAAAGQPRPDDAVIAALMAGSGIDGSLRVWFKAGVASGHHLGQQQPPEQPAA